MKLNWRSLDNAGCYVIKGDGFLVNDYGHPTFIRYIEGHRQLTLCYEYVDETTQRGRRFLIFRNYGIRVQVPAQPYWDSGTPLTESESNIVLDRICQLLAQYKKKPCRAVVNDHLYEQFA